ncbi:basic helix-loop-helix domain-containing protein USF3-like isoform X1 [Carassius carassius]|uniref:basic helix-loop-helix domain-containing protein USF3-like isoform X1 n=1 Tax=Carassius carassius TaxID=217509 RepID=UPI00286840E7|nr:basic helix-loop-helix domain-containing protein USF3-like isoform X1 [Carassius carassius]
MPEIVQNQTNNPKPPRRKKNKETHNAVERHRKEKINAGINRIGELLPCSQALKQSKNMILEEAFRYITELKRQNDEMLNGGDKVQAEEIKRLRHQLEDLRKESAHYIELLKANGINFLDDPTIHWKGKQRFAKVAKVTPTHLMSKGIIVYSNDKNSCPTSKVSIPPNPVSHLDKQPANAVTVQPACDITLGTGQSVGIGAQVNKVVVSSASSHIPVATLIPAVSKPCLTVFEQYSPLVPATPRLNPPMNYITLQGVCPQPDVSTPVHPQLQPDNPIPSLTSATCPTTPLRLQHMLSLSSVPQVVISNSVVPVAAPTEIHSVSTILPASSTLLRTSAASSTQTTWTTLQLSGNTVQPVSQALITDGASISHNPQQLSICSAGTKLLEKPSMIHLQPQVPVQLQAPTPSCIPVQPSGPRPPQIYSAVVPCPQRAVAQKSSIVSVPAIVSQAVVVHQPVETQTAQLTHPQSSVRAQPALLPKPQLNSALMTTCNPTLQPKTPVQPALPCQSHSHSTVVPQAQSAIVPQLHLSVVPQAQSVINPPTQPALVPQPQAATLPVLQTMQLLQVSSEETPAAVTSSPPSNSHVVILQQGGSCPAPQVLREDVTSQTPCQHIVIIQAPTLTPAPQSHHTAIVSTATPTLSSQTTPYNPTCTGSMQGAGTKQLVHILPRPSTQLQAQAPQTITVNGQVYVLQPAKSPDKGNSQSGQSVTPILEPTFEEPTSNVAINCLGALTNLSQSISKVSCQSNVQIYSITPPSYTTVQPLPVCGSEVSTSTETVLSSSVTLPSTAAGSAFTILPKKGCGTSGNQTRQNSVRRTKLVKQKEPKPGHSLRRIAVKSKAFVANDTCSELSTVAKSVDSVSFLNKDTVCHDVDTHGGPAPNSVSSTCSSSAIISISSSSEKSADSSVTPSVNGSIAKPTLAGGEVSKTKVKSIDDVHLHNSVTVSSVSTVSSTQGNVVVSTNCGSLSKEIFIPGVGPQLNCSVVSAALSSQCSSVDTALSVASSDIHVNSSCSVTFCSETTKQNKVSSSHVCTSSEGGSTESRPSFIESSPLLITVSSAQNNSKDKSVNSDLCQPPLPSDVSTPSQTLSISANSTEGGPMVSIMANQAISQTQNKFSRREELTDSSQNQTSFILPSTPGQDTSMSAQPIHLPETSRLSDPFKSLKRPSTMKMSITTSNQGNCADFKLPESNMNIESGKDRQSDGATEKGVTEIGAFAQKETVPPQQICTLENDSFDPPLETNRQTDSPLAGGLGGRGFSVASLLPAGHNINVSSSSFGAFNFTSEQAEILARAIFEQDSPGKRAAGCSVDSPTSTTATGWDLQKMQPAPSNKDSVTDQQVKLTKQADLPVSETSSQVSARVTQVEPLASSTTGIRLPQSIAYSQSQPSSVTSLNVNNLIRPSSNQPYPGSPNLAQQVSAPSSGGAAVMVTQSSSQVPRTCSGPTQPNEYAPLKNALMRTRVGIGMVERHQKDMPKRSAQDDLILPNKRSKLCPTGNVARGDIKATDHVQMMVGQMPSSTSAFMPRNHSDGVGALFSGNTFMNTVLRPTEGHCSTQVPTHEQTHPSVVHLQQGHTQHNALQSGQNLGGNPYLKHQQQQEQRHLYQLHHHLTQPESRIHSIHQRNLLQDQHVQKKRGVVRGAQTALNVGLQKHHLEKSGVQPPQQQQHPQQSQQHQQQQQHHQTQQSQQQQQKAQQIQQQQQSHQQQQMPPQNSHSHHQHLQQQIQQQHFGTRQDKNCEAQQAGQRAHQNNHLGQPERPSGQDHGAVQRLMGSRSMEQQQLTSQANNSVSRSLDLACTSSHQERHHLSSYSAEALIGKTPPATGEQRMGVHLQAPRSNAQDQSELRGYVDSSRGKGNITHNSQSRIPPDHANNTNAQRIPDCGPFKALVTGHQLNNFEVQVSRSGDMSSKSVPQIQRGPQPQTGFRMGTGPLGDGRSRGTYSGPHPIAQGVHIGAGLTREQEGCHHSFMQSLLGPHIPEQNGHQRAAQGCTPGSIEYNCIPGTSAGELQAKSSSPNLHPAQKAAPIHLGDNNKGHISQVSANLHGPPVRTGPPHPPTPHSSSDTGRTQGSTRSLSVSQRPHHIGPDPQSTKIRPGDRPRSGNLRPGNPFEPESSLPLPSGGGVILGRTQTGNEARRSSIVHFMADGAQVSSDNNLVSDRCAVSELTQNFGFPFIAEGGMNPPPPINANASFIPTVTQPGASRTPALLPVEPQNTLPSFYPSYSPAAHPSLQSEIPLQYFSNQMFTSPSTDKSGSAPLNNRFSSILSPPRPVGFAQASFPLLTDITPMPIGNSSGITPHLSNFNLTSLFPEIATAMPPDGSSMSMSPLLSLANTTSSDSNKQSNRPAHNISHILGHDGTSAV